MPCLNWIHKRVDDRELASSSRGAREDQPSDFGVARAYAWTPSRCPARARHADPGRGDPEEEQSRCSSPHRLRRGQARALEGIRTLARAQRASQRTGRGKLQPIGVAGENVCLSGKTGSDRRRVKTTLLTQLRHHGAACAAYVTGYAGFHVARLSMNHLAALPKVHSASKALRPISCPQKECSLRRLP
jgi:hypothetical protein